MKLTLPDAATLDARSFMDVASAIAYLQRMKATGALPDSIIILTPPPKK